MRVGIFGRRRDAHVRALQGALSALGHEPAVFDFDGFPKLNLAAWGTSQPWCYDDILSRGAMSLSDLDAAVVRCVCYSELRAEDAGGVEARELMERSRGQAAKAAFQLGLHLSLSKRIPLINPPHAHLHHRQKGSQHRLLKKAGVAVPSSLVTSDPAAARRFVESLGGRCVAKPQASGAEVVMADERFFEENEARIEVRPYLFQQYVKGRSYRAYLLGGRVVAMGEIHHDKTVVDWRERIDQVTAAAPSAELSGEMSRAVRILDLPYCGLDLEYDEVTDRTYLLDFNPAAYFVAAGRMMGVDLAREIGVYVERVVGLGGDFWG